MRIYISADMEGIAGVTAINNLLAGEFEYERARQWMTGEVAAACEAAFAAGADDIVVSDSHGNGQSILVEKLPQKVTLIRCWPRPLYMMQGIEEGRYDAAMLIGYHCGSRNYPGAIAHTASGDIIELRVNGEVWSETMLSAETAAAFGVPIIMVSGDSRYVEHAREVLGDIEAAVVKSASTGRSVHTLLPAAAEARIRESVTAAIGRIGDFRPHPPRGPYTVEFFLSNLLKIDWLQFLPGFERVDSHTVRVAVEDVVALNKLIGFVGSYAPKPV